MRKPAECIRQRVLDHIAALGPFGATCDEIEAAMGLKHQTASARVNELMAKGAIVTRGRDGRRKTRSGRLAEVWIDSRLLTDENLP